MRKDTGRTDNGKEIFVRKSVRGKISINECTRPSVFSDTDTYLNNFLFIIFFPVCFSINDYTNCTKLRANNSAYRDAIYHTGKCITDRSELDVIRNNVTHYYGCTRTVNTYEVEGNEYTPVVSSKKEPGVFINATYCAPLDRAGDVYNLFDIPTKIRKTGNSKKLGIVDDTR